MGDAAHLMTDSVTIKSQTGKSSSGDPTFGSATTIKARVEHKVRTFTDANGRNLVSGHQIVSESEIKTTDRIWLPGDTTSDDTQARRAVSVGKASTPNGYTLYEAWL